MKNLRWGLLACGKIAEAFAAGVQQSESGTLVACASRNLERAQAFGERFAIPNCHGSYEDLLDDPEVDAVYISTPHPMHAEWAIKAAEAGKHILCEKPIAINHADTMAIIDAAELHDVFLMEAFMYRCQPLIAKVVELVREDAIGEVRLIRASFGFCCPYDLDGRLLSHALGGGGILDVGCYPVSFARLIAGVALGVPNAYPIAVKGFAAIGEASDVDEWATGMLEFEGGILAQLSTGVQCAQDNAATIFGSEGRIDIPTPWFASGKAEGGKGDIILQLTGQEPETITITTDKGIYGIEADLVAASIEARQAPAPAMTWDDTLANMATLDAWRREVGLNYDADTEVGRAAGSVANRPLTVRHAVMEHATVPGLAKPVSRLVMGCDNQQIFADTAALFDAYYEAGGNTFDTAYVYGGGHMERLLGQWLEMRGVRDEMVIIAKGAHTPECYPETIAQELSISLDRMGIDHADIYFLHRDNPDVPVGEFVDALNAELDAGRITVFGGSNWTLDRVQAANNWAEDNGRQGFSAVSNNFCLANMVEPVWPGSLARSGAASRAWFEETQMPLFAWSSQGRGFFVPERAHPESVEVDLVRCWYSDVNFERQARAIELAAQKGVAPINIAAAYVLNQPFPIFALIGPRVIRELRSSLAALEVDLNEAEMAWLRDG